MAKFIVTAALPYAEGIMHLGNMVGSVLPADVYHKYLTFKGEDSIFICGSDQHGTPIEVKALEKRVAPEVLAEEIHGLTKKALLDFGCTFTHYGKTNTEENKSTVYEIFEALMKNNLIIETATEMPYCSIDKRYLPDRFIEGTCPYCKKEGARGDQCDSCGHLLEPRSLIAPHCRICANTNIVFRPVKNLAIDLKTLQPKIEAFVSTNSKNKWSKNAVNAPKPYFKEGLRPRDITRNLKWGFPVPVKGFEDATFYVWFDAPIGYIGITRETVKDWRKYWTDKERKLVQFMGKDNIEFHTIMWPGMLIGADLGYILPTTIRASEWLTAKGIKFSKSKGVGLNIQNALDIVGPDYWRFALMHLYPETADSEFSIAGFVDIVNNMMNDAIGNFVHRALTLYKNNADILKGGAAESEDLIQNIKNIEESYEKSFEKLELREALFSVLELANYGNEIMSTREPWAMASGAKTDEKSRKEFVEIMNTLLRIARDIGVLLWPFTPHASSKICAYFGIKQATYAELNNKVAVNLDEPLRPVFSKITERELALLEKFAKE